MEKKEKEEKKEEKEKDKKEVDGRGVIYSSAGVSSLRGFVSHCMCVEWETGGGSSKKRDRGSGREKERERHRVRGEKRRGAATIDSW